MQSQAKYCNYHFPQFERQKVKIAMIRLNLPNGSGLFIPMPMLRLNVITKLILINLTI